VKRLLHKILWPLLIFMIGIFVSAVVAWKSEEWIEQTEKTRFTNASNQVILLIEKALDSNVQLLQSAVAFMNASSNVTRLEWKHFADQHHVEQNFPGLHALGYAPLVRAHDRPEHERELWNEGFPYYTIFPQEEAGEIAFPITYLEPFTEHNQKGLGYDLMSEKVRKEAIFHAISRAETTLSSKIDLVQEKTDDQKPGFIILHPVYSHTPLPLSDAQRLAQTKGIVFVAVKAQTLFQTLLEANYIMVDFEIYDGDTPVLQKRLYDSNPALTMPKFERYIVLELYGKKWTLYFKSDQVLDIGLGRYLPSVQMSLGVLLFALLSAWIYALQHTREKAYRIAEEKTHRLLESEAEIRSIFQAMSEGVMVFDPQGKLIECNLASQEMFNLSLGDMLNASPSTLNACHEDGRAFLAEERPVYRVLATKQACYNVMMGHRREEGEVLWFLINAQPIFKADFETIEKVVVTCSDMSEYRRSRREIERYLNIIDTYVMISSTDTQGVITEASDAFCKISGYTKEELIAQTHHLLRHPDVPLSFYEAMWKTLQTGTSWHGEIKNRRKDGSTYWVDTIIMPRYDDADRLIGYMAIRNDITDKKRIEELSVTDQLTGLYNRLKLDELFALYLSLAKRHRSAFSIALLDIDKFKSINDTYGHQVGDIVLQELSSVLKSRIRKEDALGRWGGEEFLILLPQCDLAAAYALAEKLRALVERHALSRVGSKTVSFGVATFHIGDDEKSMVARADEALYRAKAHGRNRVECEVYTQDISF